MIQPSGADDCGGDCRGCAAVGSCPDRIVCACLRVTEQEVITAVTTLGLRTLRDIRQATDAGAGCACCHRELSAYLAVYSPAPAPTAAVCPAG